MSKISSRITAAVPGFVTGLYTGRILGELWAGWQGSTEPWLAALFTLVSVVVLSWLFSRLPIRRTWPALFLGLYVLYPESSFQVAGRVILFAFLVWWQSSEKWLHIPRPSVDSLIALILIFSCFALYLKTLAPDILPADNGEFQLIAANLGVAHPPGFTLYTMLAHLMTRLPLGPTPAFRVNLFSAITSTLTLTAVYVSVFKLTKRYLPAIAAVLALATATTYWAQATTANIRSLTALFSAVIFLTLVLFYLAKGAANSNSDSRRADRYLILFALAMGLGLSHHASLIFLGLIAVIFPLLVDPSLLRTPARWWRPVLAFLLGLLPLLYLPWRANADVRGASPGLATWQGFWEHALALGFRGDFFTYLEPSLLLERLKIMENILTFQFSTGMLLVILIALVMLTRQDWRLAFLFGGSALLFAFITATYRAPQTVEYMLPAYVALTLMLGTGAGGVAGSPRLSQAGIWISVRYVLTALIFIMATSQLLGRYDSYSRLGRDTTSRDYANKLLEGAPQDALLLANWHWATPLWYLQEVEGARPDVEIRYVFPEGEPYAQTWARRVTEGLANGRNVIATNFDNEAYAALPASEPLGKAFLFRQEPRQQLPDQYSAVDFTLGETIKVLGVHVEAAESTLSEEAVLTLAWQPVKALEPATTLFAHLVAADGRLAGQNDVPARAQHDGITLTQFRLTPFAGTQPGRYEIQVGAYAREPLLAADGSARILASSIQLMPAEFPPATQKPLNRYVEADTSRILVGYDKDNTLPDRPRLYLHWRTADGHYSEVYDMGAPVLPTYSGPWGVPSSRWGALSALNSTHYVPLGEGIVWTGSTQLTDVEPGQVSVVNQDFQSSFPVADDLVVSTRLIGYEEDGYHWAWWDLDDAIPAMGAIPTLKWIAGSEVRSPHFVKVSETAEADQALGVTLTLYDAFTGRVLPILDDRLAGDYGWIPAGEYRVPLQVTGTE